MVQLNKMCVVHGKQVCNQKCVRRLIITQTILISHTCCGQTRPSILLLAIDEFMTNDFPSMFCVRCDCIQNDNIYTNKDMIEQSK